MTETFDRETVLLLGRIDGKLDALQNQSAAVLQRMEKLEERVDDLESWRSRALGILAFLGALGATLAAFKDEILEILFK